MKLYYHTNILRMVGKSWEIRAKLREWSDRSLTLKEWLKNKGHE